MPGRWFSPADDGRVARMARAFGRGLQSLPSPALYPSDAWSEPGGGAVSAATAAAEALPFVGASALAIGSTFLPPRIDAAPGAVAAAATIMAVAASVGIAVRYARGGPWARALPSYLFFAAVAILRHVEGGAVSSFSVLTLVSLTALAINTGRANLFVGHVLMSVMFAWAILAFGPALYPAAEWRGLGLWLVVGAIASHTMQELVMETRQRAESAGRDARTDALTGLPNRRALQIVLEYEMARARRSRHPLAIAMLDLDHFKRYNDACGHGAGDSLLRAAAVSWSSALRSGDLLVRYGGEEFALVLPDTPLDTARSVTDRLRAAVPSRQTCSAGVVVWDGAESIDGVFARVDRALYAAKREGRNRVIGSPA